MKGSLQVVDDDGSPGPLAEDCGWVEGASEGNRAIPREETLS